MKPPTVFGYLFSCFLLIVPVLVLNLAWILRLPPMWQSGVFWKDIPPIIVYGEAISRIAVNVLPVLMPLHVVTKEQRLGLMIYLLGILGYFLSWVLLVYFPQSAWSTSLIGSTAAAWTSVFWLIGIGLIGDSLFVPIWYRSWVYLVLSVIFACFHTLHAVVVYFRVS